MDDRETENPDYGSSLVWSTEDSAKITALLKKYGDKDKALKALFGGSCSYATARKLSVTLAPHFGLTIEEFMNKYRSWKKGTL